MTEKSKKAVAGAAFVAGAAVGAAAGLMTKKKNRQKVARVAKTARKEIESKAKIATEKMKTEAGKLRNQLEGTQTDDQDGLPTA